MRYMLDTNAVSHLARRQLAMVQRVFAHPPSALCISSITEGELLFGLARRPEAANLRATIDQLLRHVDVLPWDSAVAARYGIERARLEARGRVLGSLDMLIAAHALEASAVLVTNDRAFAMVEGLSCEDWTVA